MTLDFTIEGLTANGFTGFESVRTLVATRYASVPRRPGVYVVVRVNANPPRFRTQSVGGWFKGVDPTAPVAVVKAAWVASSPVLYIGMAGSNLHERVRALVRFGTGHAIGHRGGRYLWQVMGSADLVVAWKPAKAARRLETQLLAAFERAYDRLPFANLSH
jgi:hypothetical protein